MSWHPQYRSSKFRHVYGKAASKEKCYDCVPITHSVHDNNFCAVNPHFIAVVTECAGGGAFLVIPIYQTGKLDPHYPRVCGHKGNVLDIKWNPFNDFVIASCSEDATVSFPVYPLCYYLCFWGREIRKELKGPGMICESTYIKARYKSRISVFLLWSGLCDPVLRRTGVITEQLSNVTPRWGSCLLFLCPTQNDLSVPLLEEDLDGSSGLLFPFYDSDVNMLYIVGKGDGNIRYYEISPEKPYLSYLMEYRSHLPQKGIGMMPKRGLEVSACEIFRFYKLIPTKSLIEPISMIVPRRSESYQEDIYPLTTGGQPAMTAQEWLNGVNKGPLLVSLRPGSGPVNFLSQLPESEPCVKSPDLNKSQGGRMPPEQMQKKSEIKESRNQLKVEERLPKNEHMSLSNGFDVFESPPPKTENELLQMFYRQQEEIRRLRELLNQRDVKIKQLELELRNAYTDTGRY
uniref:DUF1899 domain-containing protein n=1 Tax=Pavo cristatus TaxID=9049 RepID=A0A8C9EK65_PAVCR